MSLLNDVAAPDREPWVVGDRYELGPVIGSGASAVVRSARDLRARVPVAVKHFHHVPSPQELRRHRDEIAVLARLHHPGLVRLRDTGTAHGRPFVVTDLAEGPSLEERIRAGGPMRPEAVRRLGRRLAQALAYVHERGIVHRDVKPANILLERGLRPLLVDFGIARALDRTATTAGCLVGTAAYLAPEQVRGLPVGPAADVYALGLVLLETVTGRREYSGGQIEAAVARLHREPQVPDELPVDLAKLLQAMTRDDPADRPTAAHVATALTRRWVSRSAPRPRMSRGGRGEDCGGRGGRHRLRRAGAVSHLGFTLAIGALAAGAVSATPAAQHLVSGDRLPVAATARSHPQQR